ncbi:hypothetical protein C2S51_001942 [Perilla frutescens var. frutescens]|nr:hypothetical protein C2S51_001942 [Perilla frutescens var. frutescens]
MKSCMRKRYYSGTFLIKKKADHLDLEWYRMYFIGASCRWIGKPSLADQAAWPYNY